MKRREFIALLGSATAWSLSAHAQQNHVRRVSVLLGIAENDPEAKSRVKAFQQGLRDLGWSEPRNIQIDYRFAASNPDLIKKYVAEVVSLAPDVIVGNSTPVLAALRQATSSIPIVFAGLNDPVGQGFISSLAHPGANITGFTLIDFPMIGKWLDMLKDVIPDLSRVALMFNPETAPYYDVYLRSFERESGSNAIEVTATPVRSATEIETTIAKLGQNPGSALIAAADPFIVVQRDVIMRLAAKHHVPAIYFLRQFVSEGGLMSYGPDTADIFRRAASYVDRILKGEKPAELPAQSPVKFELVVNLKTAKSLGLSVRESFVQLADEIIE
jgi:putative tryptophan/tyrosine transport system substrate-binding protein